LNRLPLELYLLGTVGSEMPPTWPLEALKAQAVAARTYALQRLMIARAANRPYDLGATVLSQVYHGAKTLHPAVKKAVQATRGEVLGHGRTLIEALFHSTCGGGTVSAEEYFGNRKDYLQSRRCDWCKHSSFYHWQRRKPLQEVQERLQKAKLIAGPLQQVWRGRQHKEIRVRVHGRTIKLDSKAFRRAVKMDTISGRFTVRTHQGFVEIDGHGFGHGVGMCQWGAKGMAEAGRNYREILGHYYKGAEVRRLY
ncbi:MAG: SpoIID/LytB domain-containing protein, partial [Myxococcota bacterium]